MKLAQQILAGISLLCLLFGSGCATGAGSKAMLAEHYPQVRQVREPVIVTVEGGQATDPMWMSKISNPEFRAAVVASLRRSGLFHEVLESGNAAFRLELLLEALDQPMAGFNMTVALRVEWRLLRLPDRTEIWRDRIQSMHTAEFGKAFAGVKRLRLATEGAARENIEEGLKRLAALR